MTILFEDYESSIKSRVKTCGSPKDVIADLDHESTNRTIKELYKWKFSITDAVSFIRCMSDEVEEASAIKRMDLLQRKYGWK